MDEEQILQLLNQIPLDVLQQYLQQRMAQEQAAAEQQYGQEAYMQGADDAMAAQQGYAPEQAYQQPAVQMAVGGYMPAGYDPYLDVYRVPVGVMGPRVGRVKKRQGRR